MMTYVEELKKMKRFLLDASSHEDSSSNAGNEGDMQVSKESILRKAMKCK